jgi:general secretion pathway protein C
LNASSVLVLFQRFHRELCLVLLVLLGLACGQLAATLVGTVLRPDTSLETANRPALSSVNTQLSDRDLNQILQQNLFDPTARGRHATTVKPAQTEKNITTSTRKDLTLIGTLVSGVSSTALIEVGKETKLFHLDDPLPGGGRVESVLRSRVIIRNRDESTTELLLHEETHRKTQSAVDSATGKGIRSAGKNRWTVSRATADAARLNIGDQLRLAQMEPRITNGQTDGFLVRKLSSNSMLAQMGVKRGDVVMSVNGMSLDSPEKALQILQQLREARQLSVDLERKNQPMTFSYEIN